MDSKCLRHIRVEYDVSYIRAYYIVYVPLEGS